MSLTQFVWGLPWQAVLNNEFKCYFSSLSMKCSVAEACMYLLYMYVLVMPLHFGYAIKVSSS